MRSSTIFSRLGALGLLACTLNACAKGPAFSTLTLQNPDFELAAADGEIRGWKLKQHAGPPSYEMSIDTSERNAGKASFRIHQLKPQFYGAISQVVTLPAGADLHRVRLSAAIRTQAVTDAGFKLLLSFHGNDRVIDATEGDPISGDHRWRRVKLEASLPAGTRAVEIGATLYGAGTAWLDDVRLELEQ